MSFPSAHHSPISFFRLNIQLVYLCILFPLSSTEAAICVHTNGTPSNVASQGFNLISATMTTEMHRAAPLDTILPRPFVGPSSEEMGLHIRVAGDKLMDSSVALDKLVYGEGMSFFTSGDNNANGELYLSAPQSIELPKPIQKNELRHNNAAAAQQAPIEHYLNNLNYRSMKSEVFKCIRMYVGLFAMGCIVLFMCIIIPWLDLNIHSLLVYRRWFWFDIKERRRWWKKKNEKDPSFKIKQSYGHRSKSWLPVKWGMSLFIAASDLAVGANAYDKMADDRKY